MSYGCRGQRAPSRRWRSSGLATLWSAVSGTTSGGALRRLGNGVKNAAESPTLAACVAPTHH